MAKSKKSLLNDRYFVWAVVFLVVIGAALVYQINISKLAIDTVTAGQQGVIVKMHSTKK